MPKRSSSAFAKSTFTGTYDVTEAARILLASRSAGELYPISSRKLIRWIRRGLMDDTLSNVPGQRLLIGFEDLITLRVVSAFRAAGVGFRRIHDAEVYLKEVTEHPRPFATKLLWTDTSEVFVTLKHRLLSASRFGQIAMDIVQEFLIPIHGLTFGDRGIAIAWEPIDGVTLIPGVQFGAPCVKGTRIPTHAIWNSFLGGDSIENIASSYMVDRSTVKGAIHWEERLAA